MSEVNDCASLLLPRILDLPKELLASPLNELGGKGGMLSELLSRCILQVVPLYASTSEVPKMQLPNVVTSSLYSLKDRCPSVSVIPVSGGPGMGCRLNAPNLCSGLGVCSCCTTAGLAVCCPTLGFLAELMERLPSDRGGYTEPLLEVCRSKGGD